MSLPFPEPTAPMSSPGEVFLTYLAYFRGRIIDHVTALSEDEVRSSRLPTGWTPIELVQHLTYVERRWLVWAFEGQDLPDPWGDRRGNRWYVAPEDSVSDVVDRLRAQAEVTRAVVESHRLDEIGQPGERWGEVEPASLERVLFHLMQEYARHLGHLDIVTELATGRHGE